MSLLLSVAPFVHPGIAGIAMLAGLVPVLVHLINRRRYRRIPWAAMTFLLAAHRRSSRRMRLEHWLLMLARIAAIVLFGLAVARPYVSATAFVPARSSRMHRVVVVDNSLSMAARGEGGRTRFASAQDCAAHLLDGFPETDRVSMVTLAAPAQSVIAHETSDRRFIRERLTSLQPTQRATDVTGAMEAVVQILKESSAAAGNRAVYVISDFAARSWDSASPETPGDAVRAARRLADALADSSADMNLIQVDLPTAGNVAVTRLESRANLVGVHLPGSFAVEVTNHGNTTARNVTLQVLRDGIIVRRESLPRIEPGRVVVSSVTLEFPTPGTHSVEARISGSADDALDVDDARYLSVDVGDPRRVLIVDGRSGVRLLDGQAGFLAMALAPQAESSHGERQTGDDVDVRSFHLFAPKVVNESEFEREVLADYEAVALCNVARLSPQQWTALQRFVSEGGGLFIAAGELLGVEHYNRFGRTEESPLLPGRLGRAVESATLPGGFVGLKLSGAHPIVAEFEGEPNSGLFVSRVERYLSIEPDTRRGEVVLRYTNDAPALLASSSARGRVLLWTTTANMEWTNLPAKGDFVALMHNAFTYLLPPQGEHRNRLVGQMLVEPLTPAESSSTLVVSSGDGVTTEPSLAAHADGLAISYGPLETAQFLTVGIGSQTRTAAVNVDPMESDLALMDRAKLAVLLDRPARILSAEEAEQRPPAAAKSTELGSSVLYAALAFLMCEMWMAVRFGSGHEARRGEKT